MSVYNEAQSIAASIKSVLAQQSVCLELIVVDDGSAEIPSCTQRVCQSRRTNPSHSTTECGADRCLKCGLPTSLRSRNSASGRGDISAPNRLLTQLAYLDNNPDVVAISCGTRRLTERGEFLGNNNRDISPAEATRLLIERGVGISHAASMYRKEAFLRVGGYREQFRFAQDFDLWLRLSEVGLIGDCPEILFDVKIDEYGISATRIDQQKQLSNIAMQCYKSRRAGKSEEHLLKEAAAVSQDVRRRRTSWESFHQQRKSPVFYR